MPGNGVGSLSCLSGANGINRPMWKSPLILLPSFSPPLTSLTPGTGESKASLDLPVRDMRSRLAQKGKWTGPEKHFCTSK